MNTVVSLSELTEYAQPYYSEHEAYHNWSHGQEAMRNVCALLELIDDELRAQVDQDRVVLAAAWHDAGHAEDERSLGYATKERYAVALARLVLRPHLCQDDLDQLEVDILATTGHGEMRPTVESLVLRYADIGYMYLPNYTDEQRLERAAAYWRETGEAEWGAFVEGTRAFGDAIVQGMEHEFPRLGLEVGTAYSLDTALRRTVDYIEQVPKPSGVTS